MRALVMLQWTLISVAAAHGVGAQTSSVRGPEMQITAEIASSLLASMASDLRSLVTAQELYFSDHARYGRALSSTDRAAVFIQPSPGVTITLTYVTMSSWAGRANHDWLPGLSCVIIVGDVAPSRIPMTTGQGRAPRDEGKPVCDQP